VDGWDIEPELAVNMAFGSLVGVLDEGICDRISRVAREYDDGEVVVKDPQLSMAWYRFAADLGDTAAAWEVAELNLLSEKIVKDNEVLLKYLKKAADGGNMSAILEMGRLYAEGALLPRDRKKAFDYFKQAEAAGNQAGIIKQAQLLEQTKDRSPEDAAAYEDLLRQLIARNDPPPWAFTRLARVIQARDGICGKTCHPEPSRVRPTSCPAPSTSTAKSMRLPSCSASISAWIRQAPTSRHPNTGRTSRQALATRPSTSHPNR